jgi:hypothetical protein
MSRADVHAISIGTPHFSQRGPLVESQFPGEGKAPITIFVREQGLFIRPANKGRYYHDGRFATLFDVVNHYDTFFHLGLTSPEKRDLIEYLKSLPED